MVSSESFHDDSITTDTPIGMDRHGSRDGIIIVFQHNQHQHSHHMDVLYYWSGLGGRPCHMDVR